MIILLIKFLIIGLCAWLWYRGGKPKSKFFRKVFIPLTMALTLAIKFKIWWLFLLEGGAFQIGSLGYGNYSPEDDPKPSWLASITHDRSGEYIRALWGLIVSGTVSSILIIFGFLSLWGCLGYILLNVIVNYSVSKFKLPVKPTDLLVGAALASLVLFK